MVLVLGAVAACGPDGVPDLPAGVDPQAVTSPGPTDGPLPGLPRCGPPPSPRGGQVAGLVLPPGTVVTDVAQTGPNTSVQGYLEQTPVQVRQFYEQLAGIDLISLEDEGFEAEALYDRGPARVYVKARAICGEGSRLFAVVGSTTSPQQVPTPAGSG